ncbi:hypothetical protein IFM89_035560 [Coptis chinensis]|uniref:SKI-interacting protein SKIP SNW domain-containing protein n=1 Tax=Coptis chinensis TaxID=261450 RepID=A0A835I0D5_9MAGN|nr:hypothetical protein IFM89_035560 [Coptis chinensis]
MHSPPRPVTVEDQKNWTIPPCVSNWKNPKGYTIPLDKRLAADGRGMEDKEMVLKENERKDQKLMVLAQKAHSERNGAAPPPSAPVEPQMEDKKERLEHDRIREERQRERKRERRLEAKDVANRNKSKIARDSDRDISEKVALGMACTLR